MWSIKKIVKKGDYLYAVVPGHPKATKHGYVLEHRVVMENHIGRLLTNNEVVHHIDKDTHNNKISNLELMTVDEHSRHHHKTGRTFKLIKCNYCGKEFEREVRQLWKTKHPMCSRRCNGLNNARNLKRNKK